MEEADQGNDQKERLSIDCLIAGAGFTLGTVLRNYMGLS